MALALAVAVLLAIEPMSSPLQGRLEHLGKPVAGARVQAFARQPLDDVLGLGCTFRAIRPTLACRCGGEAAALRKRLSGPSPAPLATTTTAADGSFAFAALPDAVVVRGASDKLVAARVIGEHAPRHVTLTLRPRTQIWGQVTVEGDRGSPVHVTAVSVDTGEVTPLTVAGRRFSFELPPGSYALVATSDQADLPLGIAGADELGRPAGAINVPGIGSPQVPTIAIERLHPVEVELPGWPGSASYEVGGSCKTTGRVQHGVARLELPPGSAYLSLSEEAHLTQVRMEVKREATLQRWSATRVDGTWLSGTVTAAGLPVTSGTVTLSPASVGGSFVPGPGTIDRQGHFRVGPAVPGDYRLFVTCPEVFADQQPVTLPAPGPVKLDFPPVVPIEGTVTDARGRPAPHVSLMFTRARSLPGGAVTDDEGHFSVQGRPAGEYTLYISDPRWDSVQMPITAPATDLAIRVQREAWVQGEVRNPDGSPAEGATVTARFEGTGPHSVVTNADGSFTIAGPAGAPATLEARRGANPASAEGAAGVDPQPIILRLPEPLPLAGRVRTRDGRPVVGAKVWVGGLTRELWEKRSRNAPSDPSLALSIGEQKLTDAAGRFRFEDVPSGASHLRMDAPGLSLESDAVQGGDTHDELLAVRDPQVVAEVLGPDGGLAESFTADHQPFSLGRLELPARQVTWPLTIEVPGAMPLQVSKPADLPPGADVKLGRLATSAGGVFSGTVVDGSGQPRKLVIVCRAELARRPEGNFLSTLTPCAPTKDGQFSLLLPREGSIVRVESGPSVVAEFHAEPATGVQLVVPEPATLQIHVTDVAGTPRAGIPVDVDGPIVEGIPEYRQRLRTVRSGFQGKAGVDRIAAGDYRVRARGGSWVSVTAAGGASTEVALVAGDQDSVNEPESNPGFRPPLTPGLWGAPGSSAALRLEPADPGVRDSDPDADLDLSAADGGVGLRDRALGQTGTWITQRRSVVGGCPPGKPPEWLEVSTPGGPSQTGIPHASPYAPYGQEVGLYLWRLSDVRAACRGKVDRVVSVDSAEVAVRLRCSSGETASARYQAPLRVRCGADAPPAFRAGNSLDRSLPAFHASAKPAQVEDQTPTDVELRGPSPEYLSPTPSEMHWVKLGPDGRTAEERPPCFRWAPFEDTGSGNPCAEKVQVTLRTDEVARYRLEATYLDGSHNAGGPAEVHVPTRQERLTLEDLKVRRLVGNYMLSHKGKVPCDDALLEWLRALPGVRDAAAVPSGGITIHLPSGAKEVVCYEPPDQPR